jgi:D-Tyr-tRNAtyr deacylase
MGCEELEDKFITEEERAENAEESKNLIKQMQESLRIQSAEALAGSFRITIQVEIVCMSNTKQ